MTSMHKVKASVVIIFCSLFFSSCGGGGGSSGKIIAPPVSKFKPAQLNSPHSDVLVGCLDTTTSTALCKLSVLPFIGQTTNSPTKADILARTLTTHPWMATRFGELLDRMPSDMLLLFRGVTGVAIGADIRPSYYDPSTGAIYLDPADLWLNLTERNTISRTPDYRSDFGRELDFVPPWRYVKGNSYAWNYYSLESPVNARSLDEIVLPMAQLLFHELAHANDIMPPALLALVDPQSTPEARLTAVTSTAISTGLTTSMPLTSSVMHDLGNVLFRGATATTAQKQLTAGQVGLAFAVDGASDTYAYSSQWEDTAMLFEEVMMKYHFNVDRDLAFTDAPTYANAPCSAYVVRWGVRNRIGNELVKARAKVVVQQLLGRSSADNYFAAIPTPRSMQIGLDWCVNISINNFSAGETPRLEKTSNQPMPAGDLRRSH